MIICWNCSGECPDGSAFCVHCGAPLSKKGGKPGGTSRKKRTTHSIATKAPIEEPSRDLVPTLLNQPAVAKPSVEGAPDSARSAAVDLGQVARALRVEAGFSSKPAATRIGSVPAAFKRPPVPSADDTDGRPTARDARPPTPPVARPVVPTAPVLRHDDPGDAETSAPAQPRRSKNPTPVATLAIGPMPASLPIDAKSGPNDVTDVFDSVELEGVELEEHADDEDFDDVVIESADYGDEVEELSSVDLDSIDASSEDDILQGDELEAITPAGKTGVRPVPPPIPATRFVLRSLTDSPGSDKVVRVPESGLTLGRERADVKLDTDPYVSPRHARLDIEKGSLVVEDLGSLNGTWIRVDGEARLDSGDLFLVGHQVMKFEKVNGRAGTAAAEDGTRRLGISADRTGARLLQIADNGEPLDVYHLRRDGCRIGRHVGDIVFTDDTFMSGAHAALVVREAGYALRDLASRNGTWIRVRGRRAIELGGAVMIGRTAWRVGLPVS